MFSLSCFWLLFYFWRGGGGEGEMYTNIYYPKRYIMGNIIYKEYDGVGVGIDDIINKIATEYIVKQNFSDMKQLLDKNKYDEILDLVTTILSKNVNTEDIDVLVSKLYSSELDSRNTHLKKCRKIAVFYLKVAHLFDSIMMTINPHSNIDEMLNEERTDVNVKVKHFNACTSRLNALVNANIKIGKKGNEEGVNIASPVCNMTSAHKLSDENGIPELETLYYDEYDIENGTFTKMSDKMKREYKKDVELFYKIFMATVAADAPEPATAQATLPEKFSDIKISDIMTKDYNSLCNQSQKYVYVNTKKKAYRVEKERLFKSYVENVKSMSIFIRKREKELVYILNQVFKKDDRTNQYNIHQNLHSYTLDKLINDARRIIVQYYSRCEEYFVDGVQIYDAIVQNQIKYTTIKQIQNSNQLLEKLVSDDANANANANALDNNVVIAPVTIAEITPGAKNADVDEDDESDDEYAGEEYSPYEEYDIHRDDEDYSINEGDIETERKDE